MLDIPADNEVDIFRDKIFRCAFNRKEAKILSRGHRGELHLIPSFHQPPKVNSHHAAR